MRNLKTLAGVATMALVLNMGLAQAQDGANKTEKGAKGAGKAGRAGKGAQKGKRGGGMMQAQFKRMEGVLGKPLTEEQKTAITEAQKTYQESVAKALGMTVEEWNAKQKEFRQNQQKNNPNAGGNAQAKPAP
jgi:hypothetical protein